MYVWSHIHVASMDQPGVRRGKINISLSALFAPEIWSREMGSAVPSRVSLLISIFRLNLVLITYGIPPDTLL